MTEDKRITATKNAFRESLIDLLKTNSPERITVKMICDHCGINRSTFYRHYPSALSLYQETYDAFFEELIDILNSIHKRNMEDLISVIEHALRFLSKNREKCIVLLADRVSLGFEDEFSERYMNQLDVQIHFNPENETEQNLHSFLSGGIVNATWRWLNNPNRMSEREMAQFLTVLIRNCLSNTI